MPATVSWELQATYVTGQSAARGQGWEDGLDALISKSGNLPSRRSSGAGSSPMGQELYFQSSDSQRLLFHHRLRSPAVR